MPATLSPETKISRWLRDSGCSQRCFVDLARRSGIEINQAYVSEALVGKRTLDSTVLNRLLDLVERLQVLERVAFSLPLDWSKTERIAAALTILNVTKCAQEHGIHDFDSLATVAVEKLSDRNSAIAGRG